LRSGGGLAGATHVESPRLTTARGWYDVDWERLINYSLTIVSILLAYYWYRKTKKEIEPRYSLTDELIIDSSEVDPWGSKVEFAVGGVQVNELRRCLLVFWNAGQLPLKASEVVGPMSVELSGNVIGAVKTTASRDACMPHAEVNGKKIELSFSYLEGGDVIVLSALHEGPKADPKFQATIMGVPMGAKRSRSLYYEPDSDTDGEDDLDAGTTSRKKGRRLALFLLALAALLTKPLWDSYVQFEAIAKYAYIVLIPLTVISFFSLHPLVPEKFWVALFLPRSPWIGLNAITKKLEKDFERPAPKPGGGAVVSHFGDKPRS
jgi:hypothetical protein